MKKFFSYFFSSFRTSSYTGRTILFLLFFFLFLKQLVLIAGNHHLGSQSIEFVTTLSYYLGYFVSDFMVFLLALLIVIINIILPYKSIKIITNVFLFLIFVLFVLDIFTLYFFQSRLSLIDLQQFITPSIEDFSVMLIKSIIVLCILLFISFLLVQHKTFKQRQSLYILGSIILFFVSGTRFFFSTPQGFQKLPENIISLNISALHNYLKETASLSLPDTYEKFFTKKKGQGQQPNIIILFAESLSPIDSLRIGKIKNNLPYFDKIQKDGITFTNFINNGCTSDTAHIALLLGIEPIKLLGYNIGAYSGYKSFTESLPIFFKKRGYTPIFISTVDINFLGQKSFLEHIGFTHIIGKEYFSGHKTYVFDAAPDHVLYNKTLETIQSQTGPYFIVLQNISFHKPYNTPYGKNESNALRYTDKSLYYFYLQLKKIGFFDNGILIITSDHRKMEGLEKQEKEALGEFRYAKGLATIVGTGIIPGSINDAIIQHTDFFYSLKQLISRGLVHVSKIFNNIFSSTNTRNRGIVYCRYFQKNNKYTIVQKSGNGMAFNDLSQISRYYPFIHKYLTSYITFQQGSGIIATGNNIIIIAHQGSPKEAPENSLEGFLLAKKNGAQGVEMDVSYTKDKQLVVLHGEQMRATSSCQKKKVGNYTLEYIKNNCLLKNGEQVKTLEEILKSIDGMFDYYFIDIKVYDTKDSEQEVNDAIAVVQKLGMQDRVILSSYDKTANYVLGSHRNIIAARDTFDIGDLSAITYVNHQYFMTPYTNITETIAQEVDDLGKRLVVYTVNTTGELQQLYHQGVRMVMTDDVPLMKEWSENFFNE